MALYVKISPTFTLSYMYALVISRSNVIKMLADSYADTKLK